MYINGWFQQFSGCKNTLKNKNFQELHVLNINLPLTRKTFKNSTLILKKTVDSLLFSQISTKCARDFIEKVSSVKAGPVGLTDGRKFQYVPSELYPFVKRMSVRRAFKRINFVFVINPSYYRKSSIVSFNERRFMLIGLEDLHCRKTNSL